MDVQVGPPEVLRPLQRTSVAAVWPYCTPPHSPQEREASMLQVLGRLALLWLSTATLTYLLWQVHPPSIWAQTRPAVRPARLRASGPRPAWEPLLGKARQQLPKDSCRLVLVESIPQDLPFAAGSPSAPPLAQAWPQLLDAARESIHMASFYWSLTGPDIGVNDSSSRPVCPGPRRQLRPQAVQPGPVLGTQQVGVHLALTELWAVWGDLLGNVWVLRSWQGLGAETSLGACLTAGLALQGEALLQKLQQLLARNISLAVATSSPAPARKSTDLQVLAAQGAQVRYVPMTQLTGGVLHSKFWIVDGKHIYLGSANMDWRSLTQVKELGAVIYNCSRLAQDLEKTFQTYWVLGAPKAVLPKPWPQSFSSHINRFHPFQGQFDGVPTTAYFSASPLMLCPHGRTQDLDALLAVIGGARVFIYAEVMEFFPTTRFSRPTRYWPVLDTALRAAAVDRGVHVRLLVSCWLNTDPSMFPYLRSLQALSNPAAHVSVDVKVFIVPVRNHSNIPFSRVSHSKFMVTERAAYIGTSNWSENYFSSTSGVGLVLSQRAPNTQPGPPTAQEQLRQLFERDWSSRYAVRLDGQAQGQDCVWQD
nr:5'-3' exonuclease PLD4 isoform X3 [Manis javanica]